MVEVKKKNITVTFDEVNNKVDQRKKRKLKDNNCTNKVQSILRVILKVAKIGGYNEYHNLVIDGTPIENTNIEKLLTAASDSNIEKKDWPPSFMHLLRKAEVNPQYIPNRYLKQKLVGFTKLQPFKSESFPFVLTTPKVQKERKRKAQEPLRASERIAKKKKTSEEPKRYIDTDDGSTRAKWIKFADIR